MKILLVDDEDLSRKAIHNFLTNYLGFDVDQFHDPRTALEHWQKNRHQIVISDIKMPGMTGLELLKEIKSSVNSEYTDVILITGHADLHSSIQALRSGAWDYLIKPIDVEELATVINKAQEHLSLLKENNELKNEFDEQLTASTEEIQKKYKKLSSAYSEIVGIGKIGVFSENMKKIKDLALRFHQDRSIPVLITGETGTGKEIFARMIHYGEDVETTPFVTINCSSITSSLFESELFGYEGGSFTGSKKTGTIGKLEMAQGGTIFLDEIGDMPLHLQPKLLRVIQLKEMYRVGGVKKIDLDVRFICATNRDIPKMIAEGMFRKDLFYRLNAGSLHIPALKDRKEDITPLAQMFLRNYSDIKKRRFKLISKAAMNLLESYDWPGNVRELQNTIERSTVLYDDIELKAAHIDFLGEISDEYAAFNKNENPNGMFIDLPEDGISLEEIEQEIIKHLLKKFDGNKSRVSEYLNISRNTIRRKLNEV